MNLCCVSVFLLATKNKKSVIAEFQKVKKQNLNSFLLLYKFFDK